MYISIYLIQQSQRTQPPPTSPPTPSMIKNPVGFSFFFLFFSFFFLDKIPLVLQEQANRWLRQLAFMEARHFLQEGGGVSFSFF